MSYQPPQYPPHGPPPYQRPGLGPPGQRPLSVRKRVDLAIRGLLFFGALIGAFVLAFATDLGDAIDRLQAGGPHGSYSPKLTFLVLLLIAGVPALVAYFPLRLLVVNRFPD